METAPLLTQLAGVPSTVTTVAAQSDGSYANATQLQFGPNRITAIAYAASTKLPAATGSGRTVEVALDGAPYIVEVWPVTGEQINNFGASVAYAVPVDQCITFRDYAVGKWWFNTNLPLMYPIYNGLTAFAGGGSSSAAQLNLGSHVISTVASDLDSAKFINAIGGCELTFVTNLGAKIANVYPNNGASDIFNNMPANTPVEMPPGMTLCALDVGPPNKWMVGFLQNPAMQTCEPPITYTGASVTPTVCGAQLIFNVAGTCTVTLPSASTYRGKTIRLRTITANAVVSNASNVVPLVGGAAGTAILAATAGKWADITSDGANWQIMASN